MIMDLKDGEIHEAGAGQTNLYRKLIFEKHRIAMDAEQFTFQQSTPGGPRGDRELSAKAMMHIVDSMKTIQNVFVNSMAVETNKYFFKDSNFYKNIPAVINLNTRKLILSRVIDKLKTARSIVISNGMRVEEKQKEIDRYRVEIYKKYALPAACIIFVLLGAPLGVMVKKGGFGMAASISLFFVVIYWAFLIVGEKLADRDMLSPFWGMWAANIVLGITGFLLMIKAAKEAVIIKFDFIKKMIPKLLVEMGQSTEEANNENNR
jgi:lipopolysaccharide export system permease protein